MSSQIWMSLPLPTLHRVPFQITSRPLKILLQVYEGLHPNFEFNTSPFGKYLALKTLAQRESGFDKSLHPCFASIARLKACKFWKPIPPFDFALHIFSQLTQVIFDSSCLYPHQNFLIIPSISSHNPFGIKKQLMV